MEIEEDMASVTWRSVLAATSSVASATQFFSSRSQHNAFSNLQLQGHIAGASLQSRAFCSRHRSPEPRNHRPYFGGPRSDRTRKNKGLRPENVFTHGFIRSRTLSLQVDIHMFCMRYLGNVCGCLLPPVVWGVWGWGG